MLSDPDGLFPLLETWDDHLSSGDPLRFPGYAEKVAGIGRESVRTGLADGFVVIEGDFDVLGGSMGLVHGEKVVRALDRAIGLRLPVVAITRSGGARMQEGMVALTQMARAAAAMTRHRDAGLLSIAVYRSPTTGGVFASYASLCDLRIAEAGAVMGFAGPRVVAQTTGEEVGERSHTAEAALAAGLVDAVLPVEEIGGWVGTALGAGGGVVDVSLPVASEGAAEAGASSGDASAAWSEIERARAVGRPSGVHVTAEVASAWTEIGLGQDPALRTGLATIAGRRVVVLATDRYANHGRPGPVGYRLAQRAIALAGRLGLPLVSLVDMAGAEPGSIAENDGIAGEIARTFSALTSLPTPSLSVCVGEGGSGGALALATTDVLVLQEHAIFSVIGPEGAAAILHHDASLAREVAPLLKLTSHEVVELGVADAVVGDSVADVVDVVRRFLADPPVVGRRLERFDAATARWLEEPDRRT